jgi:hypothetical protein
MKKILIPLIIIIITFLFANIALSQDDATNQFEDVFKEILENKTTLTNGLNFLGSFSSNATRIGQFSALDAISVSFGLTFNSVFIDLTRIRELTYINDDPNQGSYIDAIPLINIGLLPTAIFYGGFKIKSLPIRGFVRGLWIPLSMIEPLSDFDDFIVAGGGIGLDVNELISLQQFEIKVAGNYHFIKGVPFMTFHSFGVLSSFAYAPQDTVVKPYISVGWNMSVMNIRADMWRVYKDYFSGSDDPTIEDLEDFIDDDFYPQYVRDQLQENLDNYDPSTDSVASLYIFEETLNYITNIPFTIGASFYLASFVINAEYTTNLIEFLNFKTGALSVSLGLNF